MRKYRIENMSCQKCQAKIEALLQEHDVQFDIDLECKQLAVYSGAETKEIIQLIATIGYEAVLIESYDTIEVPNEDEKENVIASAQYQLPDISCTNCALTISKQLETNNVEVAINAGTKQMQILQNPNGLSEKEIIAEVKKAGYTAISLSQDDHHHDHHTGHDHEEMFGQNQVWYKRGSFKLCWSIGAFLIAELPMLSHFIPGFHLPGMEILMNPWFQLVLATLTMWLVGTAFFKGAARAFSHRITTMDTLVSIGAITAYSFSLMQMYVYQANLDVHYFFEATIAIIALIYLGHYLEEKASQRTNTALKELTELHADTATLVLADGVTIRKPSDILVGDIVRVKKGEKIPLDGVIVRGQAAVNESMVTGEPIAHFKEDGMHVIGGTILESGEIDVRVLKDERSGTLSTIIKAVEKAQFEKPAIQKTADKISSIFVPFILSIAVITFIVYFAFLKADFWFSISTMLSVIVISCPCAFGLATPLSILIGSSLAAKRGILYKSGATFEQVRKIDAICFDKTGTLTKGTPSVVATLDDVHEHAGLVYQAEQKSEHPLARAMMQYIEENGYPLSSDAIEYTEEVSGKGVQVYTAKSTWYIGSLSMLQEHGCVLTERENTFIEKHASSGASIVAVFDEAKVHNLFAIRDELKAEAKELIRKLHERGIQTFMLTGDMQKPAYAIAAEAGIQANQVFYEVHPIDKLEHIKKLQEKGMTVAFVGDGINDAPALAQADLGIAVGTGAKVALSAADITLVGGNIGLIDEALQISKATLRNIFTNFGWAFSYNIIAIPIAALGLLSPTWAAFFMAFSDIVVVLNAATLKLFRKK